ncbi:MAG TPA: HAD-IA family hydrolase [Ilumatobacteraceae bacterium]|nr:HAD-IA family hydrolase [Ilumatobacteraceae bacterium]
MTRLPAAVLWDMDGTLVDTEPYWINTEYALVESYGSTWSDEHALALVGNDLLVSGAYIAEHGKVPLEPHEIVDRLLDGVVAQVEERVPWRRGARRLLAELNAAGVPCALVTMSWHRFVDPIVAQLPPGSFQTIVTGEDVTRGKPHPEPYLLAAAQLGVDATDCVAIEDSDTGMRSAIGAGCRVIGVPNVVALHQLDDVLFVGSLDELDLAALSAVMQVPTAELSNVTTAVENPSAETPDDDTAGMAARRRRGQWLLGGLAVAAIGTAAAGFVLDRYGSDDGPPPPPAPLDVWAPYWTLETTLPELPTRITSMREVSPFWYEATSAETIAIEPEASIELTDQFLEIARDSDAAIVPSITDGMPAREMAAVLADPATRSVHVDAVVEFADDGDFDGIDLDYESFAHLDGRDTWQATRPNWVAFVTELAERLHADGRTLTVSIPPLYDADATADSGYWVYDHGAIAEVVDRIRIMAYDYAPNVPGPIAPLAWVEQAVEGTKQAVADDSKLVLGVPTYGYNWVVDTEGTCPPTAEGRTGVTARSVDDLIARRGATPIRDEASGEWTFTYELEVTDGSATCTQFREVHYVDADGARARIDLAREAGIGGVALWALGYETDGTWVTIDDAIRIGTAADSTVAATTSD